MDKQALRRKLTEIEEMTKAQRERMAKDFFDIDTMIATIIKEANKGYSQYAFCPGYDKNKIKNPVTLIYTESAQKAREVLHSAGFNITYEERYFRPEENPTSAELRYKVMVVKWDGRALKDGDIGKISTSTIAPKID